jgi:hypothetical protein
VARRDPVASPRRTIRVVINEGRHGSDHPRDVGVAEGPELTEGDGSKGRRLSSFCSRLKSNSAQHHFALF